MPSRLRQNSTFAPISAATVQSIHPKSQPPQKKQKMSITQTYYLAHTARGKLSSEASRGDHDLRLLVGHANLLDSLMVELQDAEREQEAWFNQSVRKADKHEANRVQWRDTIYEDAELPDASDSDSESDSESEYDESETAAPVIPPRRLRSPPAPQRIFNDHEEEYEDEDEDNHDLALTRTQSHPIDVEQEPELVHDSEESDDESPPNSPPSALVDFSGVVARDFGISKKHTQAPTISTTEFSPNDQDYFLQETSQTQMIAVC